MVKGSAGRKSKRSTIKDVAAEAQVSISTVSLVINEKGNVSPETRGRVLASARRLGYVPTQAARQLATQRTGNIGFVVRDDHFTRSEPFYTRVFLGTEFEARHRNLYVLLTTVSEGYAPGKHTPRFLRERSIDGLIVAGKVDERFIDEAIELGVPLVLVDFERDECPAVIIDNQDGTRSAVGHLIAKGHRRIAFMGADLSHPSLAARLDGYRLALASSGLPWDDNLVLAALDGEPTRATGTLMAPRLFELDPMPTAVVCINDAMALSVLDYARREGIRVPEDLAVVGFDDISEAAHAQPGLTTVQVLKEQLGELAMRYLVDLIEKQDRASFIRGGHTIKIKTELVIRDSG